MILKIFLHRLVLTDMVWHRLKRTKQMFPFFSPLFFPPLLLSNSDNVQMQKHRHLLCFKGATERKMNTNFAVSYVSV